MGVRVALELDSRTDAEDEYRMGPGLRNELRAVDVDAVSAVDGAVSDGARPGVAAPSVAGHLSVGGVFVTVVSAIPDWMAGGPWPMR
ncbi:hypothetical protein [Geodermatophilus sp. SYSU D01176]